jgi:hypothetical protein
MAISHGMSGYARGCRCDTCRSVECERKRAQRIRKRTGIQSRERVVAVSSLAPQPVRAVPGMVEKSVVAEAEQFSERPGMVAGALAMARIIDNPSLVHLWPQSTRQLQAILDGLRSGTKKKSRDRLAAVQQMTAVGRPKAGNVFSGR